MPDPFDFSDLTKAKSSPEYKRLKALLSDREWRLDNLYWIKDEHGNEVRFVRNAAQRAYYKVRHYRDLIAKARQLGYCYDPNMRVLTGDLRWMRIGDLKIGDELVSVDESCEHVPGAKARHRKMRRALVEGMRVVHDYAYRVTMDNGVVLIATGRHRHLCRSRGGVEPIWRSVSDTRIGDDIRYITKPWGEATFEDGWFGGLLDGEGSMRQKPQGGFEITISQVPGGVLDRARKYLDERGYVYREDIDGRKGGETSKLGNKPVHKLVLHRTGEAFRLLGQTRPTRFIEKEWWEGHKLPGLRNGMGWCSVIKIELLPEQPMIDIQTSTKTFICEGFVSHNSTLIEILMLDMCLFTKGTRAGIIDNTLDDATKKLNIVKFAYDRLPEAIKAAIPLAKRNTETMEFANGSTIEIGTSARGGTFQFLHISEYGKTSVDSPDTAREIKIGAIPAVHAGNWLIVESTAHGTAGEFHDMVQRAAALQKEGRALSDLDFRLHFYGWWVKPEYRVPNHLVQITQELREYFASIAPALLSQGIRLDGDQQAWYAQQYYDLGPDDCRQEYPSTFLECFYNSLAGAYFKAELSKARAEGRIGQLVPHDPTRRVNTFWDIGEDGTAILWHQTDGLRHRFIDYWEEEGGSIQSAAGVVDQKRIERKFIYDQHYGPHDLDNKDWGNNAKSRKDVGLELGIKFNVVERVLVKADSIEAARRMLTLSWFDSEHCSLLVERLDNYRKKWNKSLGQFSAEPEHKRPSHPADALQQGAMGLAPDRVPREARNRGERKTSSWAS